MQERESESGSESESEVEGNQGMKLQNVKGGDQRRSEAARTSR